MSKKTLLKLGLFCAIMFGVWRLWENDAAVNAFILFCTAGVVPGTGVELTPEQVYIVLGSILFIAIMLIFAKELVRDVRAVRNAWRRWRQKPTVNTAEAAVAQLVKTVVSAPAAATEQEPAQAPATESKPVVVIALPAQPTRLTKVWRAVRPKLIVAAGASLEFLLRAADRSAVQVSRASLQGYRYGMQAWLWAEPYLRRFDKWLETTLKSNKDIAALLHMGSDFLKTANARLVELRARLARVPRAPED